MPSFNEDHLTAIKQEPLTLPAIIKQQPSMLTATIKHGLLSPASEESTIRRPARRLRPTGGPVHYVHQPSSPVPSQKQEEKQEEEEKHEEEEDDEQERAIRYPSLCLRFKRGDDTVLTCDRLDVNGRPLPKLREIWELEQEPTATAAAAAAAATAARASLVPSLAVVPSTPPRRLFTDDKKRKRGEFFESETDEGMPKKKMCDPEEAESSGGGDDRNAGLNADAWLRKMVWEIGEAEWKEMVENGSIYWMPPPPGDYPLPEDVTEDVV